MADPVRQMKDLVDLINKASHAYYVLDNPIISDMQWDKLYDELKALEQKTGIILPDSPTHHVGGDPLEAFVPHSHISKLWSMDKVNSMEGLEAWIAKTEKLAGRTDLEYYVEYKFDGLTLNLTYRGGKLIQAATRGNGTVGEAILPQAMTILSIPKVIPYKGLMEIQGECIMRLSTLEKYNKTAAVPMKNARNAAAGGLRNLDPKVTAARHLDAFFYQIGTIENPPYRTQPEMLDFIRKQGFQVSPYLGRGTGRDELEKCIKYIEYERPHLDWLIDGAVIKVSDMDLREKMGFTDKFPRWAVAYKFKAEECVTKLEDVTWELGRTGKLTPVAHVTPVDFYGVTVQKATLNNMDDIRRKDIAIGCNVWLRRSNDVIPEIMGRAGDIQPDEREIMEPNVCPDCGKPLVRRGAHIFCMNRESCKTQAVARIAHFCSREAMNIKGINTKTIELLYEMFGVRLPSDLYYLKGKGIGKSDIREVRIALLNSIEVSKSCKLSAFIFALGIPGVGKKTARDLAARYSSIDKLQKATIEELAEIPDIGEAVAGNIVEYLSFKQNREMVQKILNAGVKPEPEAEVKEGIFSGMSIAVTGTLKKYSRSEVQDIIEKNGGTAVGSVSRKTTFLVAGEDPGSSLSKAEFLGVEVIDENEFLRRLEQSKQTDE